MLRLVRFTLRLTALLMLTMTTLLAFAQADDSDEYQLIFTTDLLSQGPQIYTVNVDGSNLQQVSFNPDYDRGWQSCATPSPDGAWIASFSYYLEADLVYSIRSRAGDDAVEFSHVLDSGDCHQMAWVGDWFYFTEEHILYRVHPSDLTQPEIVGQSNTLISNIYPSPDGQWLFYPTSGTAVIFFHTQEQRFLHFEGYGGCNDAAWSPDSRYLICVTESEELRLFDVQNVMDTFVTSGVDPVWSPDAQWIVFWHERELVRVHPDGSEAETLYTLADEYEITARDMTPLWHPSGEWLLLPNLCVPAEYIPDCDTYRFTLADATLTPIRPIFRYSRNDGTFEEQEVSIRDPQFLPPQE